MMKVAALRLITKV